MQFSARIIGIGTGLALFQSMIVAGEPAGLTSEADRIGYSLGHQIGRDLKQQNEELDTAIIRRGVEDGLAGKDPLLPEEEMQTSLRAFKQDIVTSEQQERLQAIKERRIKREMARKDGEAFMAANTKKTGVTTLPSGLQYRIVKPGEGRKAALADTVTVHYRGTLLDGSEFDSTPEDEPASFPVKEVIPGLQEALQLMQPGARWELYIPPGLGFGRRGPLEDQTLVYNIELLAITSPGKDEAAVKDSQAD